MGVLTAALGRLLLIILSVTINIHIYYYIIIIQIVLLFFIYIIIIYISVVSATMPEGPSLGRGRVLPVEGKVGEVGGCVCARPTATIFCEMCGFTLQGRINMPCRLHKKVSEACTGIL